MPAARQVDDHDEHAEERVPPRAWLVLVAAMFGQLPISMLLFGLPSLSPTLHDDLGIGIGRFGVVLGALNLGFTLTVLPWGMAADRWGERRVASLGLTLSIGAVLLLAGAGSFLQLTLLAALAGTVASCSHPAGSIAVMRSFPPHRRSLAYAIRHTATPLGGLVAATAMPALARVHDRPLGASPHGLAIGAVAVVAAVAAVVVLVVLPGRDAIGLAGATATTAAARPSLRQPADVVRIAAAASTLGVVQLVSTGFLVLFLHEHRGVPGASAAAALAVVQGLAIVARPLEGVLADRFGSRVAPLRTSAIALVALLPVAGLVTWLAADGAATTVALGLLLGLVGVVASGWNGVAVAAVAERARAGEVGGATALLTAMLAATNTVSPIAFAAIVGGVGWAASFAALAVIPAVGVLLLRRVTPAGPGPRRRRSTPGPGRGPGLDPGPELEPLA